MILIVRICKDMIVINKNHEVKLLENSLKLKKTEYYL